MTWYYVKEGEAAGPISDEELLSKLRIGSILPTTLVWRSGMAEWQAASRVSEQIAVAAPPVPPQGPAFPVRSEPNPGTPPVLPNFFCTMCGNIIPADQLVRISGRAVCAACKPRYVQQMQEGLNAPVKVPVLDGTIAGTGAAEESGLADPGTRFIAYILDVVFVGVPIMLGYFVVAALAFGTIVAVGPTGSSQVLGMMSAMFIFIGFAFAWAFFYWTWFIGRSGATPGMKIMKLKMVRADRGSVSYSLAFGRALLLYIVNAFTMGLTNLTALFDREKRTMVDMICGTRVVWMKQ